MEDRFDEAADRFKGALELRPDDPEVLEGLTQASLGRHDLAGALEWAKRWTAADPEAVLPHTNLSIIYQKMGRIEDAEREGAVARTLGWKQELREQKQAGQG